MGIKPELIAKKYYRLAGGRVPVNLERLCRRLGFAIVEWPGPPDFASLLSVPHRIVVVNRNMRYARRRFSVAHELGHYALGQAGVQFFAERGRAERAANRFGAALLMPAAAVGAAWSEYKNEPAPYCVRLVAFTLGVSTAAAAVRVDELGLAKSNIN